MLCRSPYVRDPSGKLLTFGKLYRGVDPINFAPFPCGQCLPCRIHKKQVWTLRLILENYYHDSACFITLTYSDENLPYTDDMKPTLCKRDVQLFMKRLRKHFFDKKIRFYCAGEYGSISSRPHYHLIIYGLDALDLDPDYLHFQGRSGDRRHPRSVLYDLWTYGLVHVADVSRETFSYCAGYVVKKIVARKGDGRVKEFSLMSRMPAIGSQAVADIAKTLEHYGLEDRSKKQLRIDGRTFPLGRYLVNRLSDALEIDEPYDLDTYLTELKGEYIEAKKHHVDFLEHLVSLHDGTYAHVAARTKIFNSRSKI